MNSAYFQDIPEHLCQHLSQAQRSIKIAVCWFSHRAIFQSLLERLKSGVSVELLLEYDSQNIKEDGLDFQNFIRCGGQFWASRSSGLMHHKFAIIDDAHLLTGSFNWTYNSNAENILVTTHSSFVNAYLREFENLKICAQRIVQVSCTDVKPFAPFPLFENTEYPLQVLRKKISSGISVWSVRVDKYLSKIENFYSNKYLPYDAKGYIYSYWNVYRIWDNLLFETTLSEIKTDLSEQSIRELRNFSQRMKIGELIFAIEKPRKKKLDTAPAAQYISAIGIVQSAPLPFDGGTYSTYRSVQWLKIFPDLQQPIEEKISTQSIARFQGSALRVLQAVFSPLPPSKNLPTTG